MFFFRLATLCAEMMQCTALKAVLYTYGIVNKLPSIDVFLPPALLVMIVKKGVHGSGGTICL
jgi:hypothetical protein